MQVHANALNLTSEPRKKVNFESSIFFHENSCKWTKMHWISHLNQEKSEIWKFNIFSWKFMQVHANALNLTSEPKKKWTLKVQYFFMKIHASALKCIESHIWTKKKVNYESSIFFHENSCKCMTMHWKSLLNHESSIFLNHNKFNTSEPWKFNIFSWKFMQVH